MRSRIHNPNDAWHAYYLKMGEMTGTSNGRGGKNPVFPKTEDFDYELSPYTALSRDFRETAASSSGSKVRGFFIGMGFLPGLVDKVIEENGEENSDALLEILLRCSTNGDSSDSLEGSLNTNEHRSIPNFFPNAHSKEVACFAIPTLNACSLFGQKLLLLFTRPSRLKI
ncbi:hypothetical protein MTR_0336s0070 [Medicago truncatula]|uniref:Uncharacterized protein n=1 Tax=Medicago truncatula TaxID=3880 RepID=A0A072TFD5_MEDTR|nr:hypothetical protein MTR_0336s0070 [Medicago truncatula]